MLLFLMCLILAITGIWSILVWNKRIRTWDQVPCIILSNKVEKKSAVKHIKKVSVVTYKYEYKNRSYTGDRILYDSDTFPEWVKKGSTGRVLVDPANPSRSAVMFAYRGIWHLLRYVPTLLFSGLAIFFLTLFLRSLPARTFMLPENLKEYIRKNPPEKSVVSSPHLRSNFYMDFPPEEAEKDHWIIRSKKPAGLLLPIAGTFFFFVSAAIFLQQSSVILLYAIFCFFSIFLYIRHQRFLIFDLREKCFYRSRKFAPEKMLKVRKTAFADIECLCLQAQPDTNECLVCAMNRKKAMLILFKIRSKEFPHYALFLPVLAEKMGNIPVILI